MRTLLIPFIALFLIFSGCEKDSEVGIYGFYDELHFERQGGGQIEFEVYPTNDSKKLKVLVSKYDYKDTTIVIMLDKSIDNSSTFSAFHEASNNQIRIDGSFQQSDMETGTWAYIYFIADNSQTEVTNSDLRSILLNFEQLVIEQLNY